MTKDASPTDSEILAAIQRSGYLMDQEVASTLEELGFHVQTSWAFEDPDQGESRELDVWAVRQVANAGDLQLFVELFCECKSGADRPFVFLSRRKSEMDANICPDHFVFPHDDYEKPTEIGSTVLPAFRYLGLARHHYWFTSNNKAVQFAKIVPDKSQWQAQHDGLYNALLLPLAKAIQHRRRSLQARHHPLVLAVPVVVLKSNLFEIDTGASPVALHQTSHVSFYRHLESRSVRGHYIVDFVAAAGLGQFITGYVLPFAEQVAAMVRSNPAMFTDRRPQR